MRPQGIQAPIARLKAGTRLHQLESCGRYTGWKGNLRIDSKIIHYTDFSGGSASKLLCPQYTRNTWLLRFHFNPGKRHCRPEYRAGPSHLLKAAMSSATTNGPVPLPMSSRTVIIPKASPLLSGSFTLSSTALQKPTHSAALSALVKHQFKMRAQGMPSQQTLHACSNMQRELDLRISDEALCE